MAVDRGSVLTTDFVNNSLDIDRTLISHPEMRQYFYGDAPIDPEKVDVPLLMSIIELMIDVIENIEVFQDRIPKDRRNGRMRFVSDVKNSSVYRYYMDPVHTPWYEVESDR